VVRVHVLKKKEWQLVLRKKVNHNSCNNILKERNIIVSLFYF
jgi:hypothetical protein